MNEPLRADRGDLNHDERDNCQRGSDVDIAGRRRTVGKHAEKVHRQNEEKRRQQVRKVLQSDLAHVGDCDLIAYEHDNHFNEITKTARDKRFEVFSGGPYRQQRNEQRGNPQKHNVLRDGKIERQPSDLNRIEVWKVHVTDEGELELMRIVGMFKELGKKLSTALRFMDGSASALQGVVNDFGFLWRMQKHVYALCCFC
jgi:hypothetical protein